MRFTISWNVVAAMALLFGGEYAQASSFYSQVADSSVGKKPYIVLANAAGALDAAGAWERMGNSFRGKPSSVVLSEGPPPRGREHPQAGFFYLYADHHSRVNHFQPTGYMGDRQNVRLDDNNTEDPANGLTCVKITYAPTPGAGQGWAGVYWLNPRTNWGYKPGGYNLSDMTRLTFWARGAKGGEQIALFKAGGIEGPHADTGSASIGPVWLTQEWKQYTIDLSDADFSKVSGGFAWSADGSANVGELAFYLDDIRYER